MTVLETGGSENTVQFILSEERSARPALVVSPSSSAREVVAVVLVRAIVPLSVSELPAAGTELVSLSSDFFLLQPMASDVAARAASP